MRAAVCAVLLLLTLYEGEALKCNYCFGKTGDLCQPTSTQTCSGRADACAAVIFTGALNYSFRQCMNMAVCEGYITTPGVFARCCSTDLCNWASSRRPETIWWRTAHRSSSALLAACCCCTSAMKTKSVLRLQTELKKMNGVRDYVPSSNPIVPLVWG